MAVTVELPALGESVVEGTITKWLVKEGDRVERDQPLVEVSTDKVDAEIPAPEAGVLARISRAIIATGSDVLVVDLSLPGLRQHGLHTFKVLVPEAYTMNFDARWPHFGGRRMQEAPVRAGLLDKPVPFDQLNTVPHPFP